MPAIVALKLARSLSAERSALPKQVKGRNVDPEA